jgi:hypothetical protein
MTLMPINKDIQGEAPCWWLDVWQDSAGVMFGSMSEPGDVYTIITGAGMFGDNMGPAQSSCTNLIIEFTIGRVESINPLVVYQFTGRIAATPELKECEPAHKSEIRTTLDYVAVEECTGGGCGTLANPLEWVGDGTITVTCAGNPCDA